MEKWRTSWSVLPIREHLISWPEAKEAACMERLQNSRTSPWPSLLPFSFILAGQPIWGLAEGGGLTHGGLLIPFNDTVFPPRRCAMLYILYLDTFWLFVEAVVRSNCCAFMQSGQFIKTGHSLAAGLFLASLLESLTRTQQGSWSRRL